MSSGRTLPPTGKVRQCWVEQSPDSPFPFHSRVLQSTFRTSNLSRALTVYLCGPGLMSDHIPLRESSSSLANVLSEARGMAASSFTPDPLIDKRPAKLLIPRRTGSPKTDATPISISVAQDLKKAPVLTTSGSNVRPSEGIPPVVLPRGSSKQSTDKELLTNQQKNSPSIFPEGDKLAAATSISAAQNSTRKGRLGMLPPKNPVHEIPHTTLEPTPTSTMAMEPVHKHHPITQSHSKDPKGHPSKALVAVKGHTIPTPPTKPSKDCSLDRNPNPAHRKLKQTSSVTNHLNTKSKYLNAGVDTDLDYDINPYSFDILSYLPPSSDENFERLSLYCQ